MFKKIRNRILLLNMVMVSSVVIAAFVVVFVTTYTQTINDNREKLTFAMPAQHIAVPGDFIRQGMVYYNDRSFGDRPVPGMTRGISPFAGMSFSIMLDSENNIVLVNSLFDWEQETYDRIAAEVLEAGGGTDTITVEGRVWQYVVSPIIAFYREALYEGADLELPPGWAIAREAAFGGETERGDASGGAAEWDGASGGETERDGASGGVIERDGASGGAAERDGASGGVVARYGEFDGTIVREGRVGGAVIGGMDATWFFPGNVTESEYIHIRFLDVTDSHRMLSSLAFTLSGLSLVILAVFFFISLAFANRAIRPMEEAWAKQSRFIADASHEIKTPLSVINANCGVLYAGKEETVESQLKWVDSIMRATGRMSGLINKLLALASVEDTLLAMQTATFDLSGAVAESVSEMEAAAIEKGLVLYKEIEPGIEIESDRENVRKVMSILLDNAVKYTGEGGEVTVALNKGRRHISCSVRNTGGGIPPEDLPYLFDRFYRGDPARSSENSGYGLGLAIAKAAANQMGAKLTVESVLGEFTEFRLEFTSFPGSS